MHGMGKVIPQGVEGCVRAVWGRQVMKREIGVDAPVYGERPWSGGGFGQDDPHEKRFYRNAAKEYAVCKDCERPECVGCNPLNRRRKTRCGYLEKVIEMALAGKSDQQIANALGKGKSTITSSRLRNGIQAGTKVRKLKEV